MTPGLARCIRYKGSTPSGTEVGMRPDQAPFANSRSTVTEWPRHRGGQAAGHVRRLPNWPVLTDAASRQGFGLHRPANFPGTAAR